jgi:rod shape-determining protein MreC
MTVDHRLRYLEEVRFALSTIVFPLRYAVDLPVSAGGWLHDHLASREQLVVENQSLRAEQLLLHARLQRLDALEQENEHLRHLLDSSGKIADRVLIAELLAAELDPWKQQILINRGRIAGAYIGQPLIDADGIMGQIIHTAPFTSIAMLITDSGHATPIQVNRNGLRTIAVGTGEIDRLELPYLPNNADLEIGDLLITSGLGGKLPAGYPVGRITRIEQTPGQPFARIDAAPTARLDRSRQVLLVWPGSESTPLTQFGVDDEPAGEPVE